MHIIASFCDIVLYIRHALLIRVLHLLCWIPPPSIIMGAAVGAIGGFFMGRRALANYAQRSEAVRGRASRGQSRRRTTSAGEGPTADLREKSAPRLVRQ